MESAAAQLDVRLTSESLLHLAHVTRTLACAASAIAALACDTPKDRTVVQPSSASAAPVEKPITTEPAVERTCFGDSLLVSSGTKACAWLDEAELLGELVGATTDTFLLVLGRGCTDCDAIPQVLLRRIGAPQLRWSAPIPGDFVPPGDISSSDDSSRIVARIRLFFGECVVEPGPEVVQVDLAAPSVGDSLMITVGRLTVPEVTTDSLRVPRSVLSQIDQQVTRGACHEVPRRNRQQEPEYAT
jgi:hypothetical protein